MILVDANILVYAHVDSFPQHRTTRTWLDAQLYGEDRVGLPWHSLLRFLRIVSNPCVFEKPGPLPEARKQVGEWLACESVWVPVPTERHANLLEQFLVASAVSGNLAPDAHLAALALEYGLTLCSTDGDFARLRV